MWRMRRVPLSAVVLLLGLSLPLVFLLSVFGGVMVMPPLWVHFYGVGVSALARLPAAACSSRSGPRRRRAHGRRGGGFTIMATFLAVHGLVTPGVLVGNNGVIALTGAATLPVGAAVLALSGCAVEPPRSIPFVIGLRARLPWRSWRSARSASGAPACSVGAERTLERRVDATGHRVVLFGARDQGREHLPADSPVGRPGCRGGTRPALGVALRRAGARLHGSRLVDRPRVRARGDRSSAARSPTTCAGAANHGRSSATYAPPRSSPPRRPSSEPVFGR